MFEKIKFNIILYPVLYPDKNQGMADEFELTLVPHSCSKAHNLLCAGLMSHLIKLKYRWDGWPTIQKIIEERKHVRLDCFRFDCTMQFSTGFLSKIMSIR
jgi:hypothetical protein